MECIQYQWIDTVCLFSTIVIFQHSCGFCLQCYYLILIQTLLRTAILLTHMVVNIM